MTKTHYCLRTEWIQLKNLELPEFAAFDYQASIDIALATYLPRLNQLRRMLRSRMEASQLMDGKHFAAAIEAAYCQIWQNSCNPQD